VGMRFDDRVTGKISGFAKDAKIIHIDLDPAEIGKNVNVNVPIVGDVKHVLNNLLKATNSTQHTEWVNQLEDWRHDHPLTDVRKSSTLLPQYIVRKLYEATRGQAVVVTGVGQHQMWTAQYYTFHDPRTFVSSGGLGTMGFGLPAAMGAKVGKPDKPVWVIDGDGSFQMNIQELATLVQDDINVKIAVLNNGFLGMVRQWQELFHNRNYVATPLSAPDLVGVAEAYGVAALRVTERDMVEDAIRQAAEHDGPFLIDFRVEPEENVFPMVPPGAATAEFMEEPKQEVSTWQRRSTRS